MPQNVYPIYYIQILKELEKKERTKQELRESLKLTNSQLYRAIYRLVLDGLIIKEIKNGKELWKLTENGREYLRQLKEIVTK